MVGRCRHETRRPGAPARQLRTPRRCPWNAASSIPKTPTSKSRRERCSWMEDTREEAPPRRISLRTSERRVTSNPREGGTRYLPECIATSARIGTRCRLRFEAGEPTCSAGKFPRAHGNLLMGRFSEVSTLQETLIGVRVFESLATPNRLFASVRLPTSQVDERLSADNHSL